MLGRKQEKILGEGDWQELGLGSSPFSLDAAESGRAAGKKVWVAVGCQSLTHPSLAVRALLKDPGDLDPEEFRDGTGAVGLHSNQVQKVSRKRILQKKGSGDAAEQRSCLRPERFHSKSAVASPAICSVESD